jgi:D-xylose transport system substrate-binding protein
MRYLRPLAVLALAATALTFFASPEKPVIGLSLDTLKEERWQRDRDNFIAEVEGLGGTVVVQSANSDDTRQVRDIESLITRGVDVLAVVPHNGEAMVRALRSAKESGIPVIAYDRLILNGELAAYVTFDNVKVGELQAQWVVDRWTSDKPLRVVRIYGAPTDNNAKLFKQGQDNVLNPLIASGRVKVVGRPRPVSNPTLGIRLRRGGR